MDNDNLIHLINSYNRTSNEIARKKLQAKRAIDREKYRAVMGEVIDLELSHREESGAIFEFFQDQWGMIPDSFRLGDTVWEYRGKEGQFVPGHRYINVNDYFEKHAASEER